MEHAYRPVPCAFHERLEFAVLRRQRLQLVFVDEHGEHSHGVLPLDVYTRDGAEWLSFSEGGEAPRQIRLDHIRFVNDASSSK